MSVKTRLGLALGGIGLGIAVAHYGAGDAQVSRAAQAHAAEALAVIPPELRPAQPQLELPPPTSGSALQVVGLEYRPGRRAIVVGLGGAEVGRSVWLHELAHARLDGARPKGAVARRVIDAFEEGVADYFAAAISGSPVLGSGAEQRDLRRPPRVGASEWASLAFGGFDTHRMGWSLAALLYARDPGGGSLLRDAVACLDGPSALESVSDGPAPALDALLAACPEQGRARLASVLSAWLPREVQPVEVPT